MRSSVVLAGAVLMVQGKVSRSVGWVDSAPNLARCPVDSIAHDPSGLDMPIANKTSPEYRYSEIVLHYSDGAKSVVSATGRDPRCSREVSIRQHASSGSTTAFGYPYKATWTQLRYTLPPPSESSCVRDEDMVNEKVEVMHIEVLPSDASASTTLASNSHEMTFDAQPVVAEDPETAEFLGEEDNILIRRRATFGELCQLLVLFTILGLLHYVSMRWAARWHAPRADVERRIPQCEQQLT